VILDVVSSTQLSLLRRVVLEGHGGDGAEEEGARHAPRIPPAGEPSQRPAVVTIFESF
jgi:hypothetical protein